MQRSDFEDVRLSELRRSLSFPLNVRPMLDLVGMVTADRVPSEVPWMDTAEMTVAAVVRRLKVRTCGRSVDQFAHNARRGVRYAIHLCSAIPPMIAAEWPNQAGFPVMLDVPDQPVLPCPRRKPGRHVRFNVARKKQPLIVENAIASRAVFSAASLDQTPVAPNCRSGVRVAVSTLTHVVGAAETICPSGPVAPFERARRAFISVRLAGVAVTHPALIVLAAPFPPLNGLVAALDRA